MAQLELLIESGITGLRFGFAPAHLLHLLLSLHHQASECLMQHGSLLLHRTQDCMPLLAVLSQMH